MGSTQLLTALVGLEVHAQIFSKVFSKVKALFGEKPNTLVSLLDAGFPGTLPVLNRRCLDAAIITGLALRGNISNYVTFDRKHYFYSDLPLGYQITQKTPIVTGGYVIVKDERGMGREIRIEGVHLEQDSGKSFELQGTKATLVDLNRCGVGLLEIVTKPDLRNGQEALTFVRELRRILQEIGVCTAKVAAGEMRVDANVSVHSPGGPPGTRVELKNVSGAKSLREAIDQEIDRQKELTTSGYAVSRETRSYSLRSRSTFVKRVKESLEDYRYLPEPDLPAILVPKSYVEHLRTRLPELPLNTLSRISKQYGIGTRQCQILVARPGAVQYFEKGSEKVCQGRKASLVASLVVYDVMKELNKQKIENFEDCPLPPERLGILVDAVAEGIVSVSNAKLVIPHLFASSKSVAQIIEENNWRQIDDPEEAERFCRSCFSNSPVFVEYLKGKREKLGTLLGLVKEKSNGRIPSGLVIESINKLQAEHKHI